MNLPVSFDNIPYYKGAFGGDIIVADGVMYFFPHTDLGKERSEVHKNFTLGSSPLFILMGLVIGETAYVIRKQQRKTSNKSKLFRQGIGLHEKATIPSRSKLDTYVLEIKQQKRSIEGFSSSLPKPERFELNDVKNLSISAMGRLVFDTHYDKHDFKVGIGRKKLLQEALKQAGFIR